MTSMDVKTIEKFLFNYSKERDFDKIEFNWNGEFGSKFEDFNYNFRLRLCEFIFPQIEKVSLDLIRDLYLEFGKSSEASFGAYIKMNLLGQELLTRGGTKYIEDYLRGAANTVDTYAVTANINISRELAGEVLSFIDEKLKETSTEKERFMLEQIGKRRFEILAKGRQKKL